jgi:hypothetical protein
VVVNDGGDLVRPWLTAWMDMRSRLIVGWCITGHDPNQNSILSALRGAILEHGIPERLYVDNGKDFDSYVFHGRSKWQRRHGKVQLNPAHVCGILNHLDVKAKFCWAYHGQSKPIERFFGTLEGGWCHTWPTWIGNSPQTRPEDAWARINAGEAPALADFVESFRAWLANNYQHPNSQHGGDGMDGGSPLVVYEDSWKGHSKRTTSAAMLDLLLCKQTQPTKVGKNGVTYRGLRYGQYSPELFQHFGQEVYLRVDERDITSVQVWSPDDKLICVAPANDKVPANADEQTLRAAIARKKAHRKLVREYHDQRMRLSEDLPELMTRSTSKVRPVLSERQRVEGPNLKPLRSPLEDQLPFVHKGLERLRTGTDDQPLPERFIYKSSFIAEEDEP